MNKSYPLVIGDVTGTYDFSGLECSEPSFLLQNNKHLHLSEANDQVLKFLVCSILRKPKALLVHLQRITLCYEQQNEEHLYAALADLFVVLQDAGQSIKRRMLLGSRKHLAPPLMQQLQSYLDGKHVIQGNLHTVLTSGIESNNEMVLSQISEEADSEHDPLQIARDYIEYSQLDQAKEVLENAILVSPENTELHEDLLELYKSTRNVDAFNSMLHALSEVKHPMQAQWDELSTYFTK